MVPSSRLFGRGAAWYWTAEETKRHTRGTLIVYHRHICLFFVFIGLPFFFVAGECEKRTKVDRAVRQDGHVYYKRAHTHSLMRVPLFYVVENMISLKSGPRRGRRPRSTSRISSSCSSCRSCFPRARPSRRRSPSPTTHVAARITK